MPVLLFGSGHPFLRPCWNLLDCSMNVLMGLSLSFHCQWWPVRCVLSNLEYTMLQASLVRIWLQSVLEHILISLWSTGLANHITE